MNSLHQLSSFLQGVTSDVQLRACHISLYAVLCKGWIDNGCKNPFSITRSKVMKLARINSKATYHRIIRELTSHGHILYSPSYHPVKGSEVSLIENDMLV
jgi:hypothetical protein